jgi:hypothetical protein
MIRKSLICLLVLSFSGCIVRGPKTENKTPLAALNGKSYDVSEDSGGQRLLVPILTKKDRASVIEGRLEMKNGIASVPLRFVKIGLFDSGEKLVTESTTDPSGIFRLNGIVPNGSYKVKVLSEKYRGSATVDVKDYVTHDVLIFAESSAAK